MGFNNGVYDFKNHIFRPGRPEDYVTKTTGINYVEFNPRSIEYE
jgi:phage/plasmid-associated DNA primase